MRCTSGTILGSLIGLLLAGGATALGAQAPCRVLCTPTVTLMPGLLRNHLRGGPRVRSLSTGAEQRLPSSSDFELIIAASAATAVPRLTLYGSVQWLPNASESRNPFTQYRASELGERIRANAPTVSMGAAVGILPASATGGWLDAGVNVADLFSQAARPGDASAYTHKLDLDLVAHAHVFNAAPTHTYLHRIAAYGILDYVATGLPRTGDEVPAGRVFLESARPLALIIGLAIPVTPEVR
jgi:hypothetical protein